MNELGKVSLVGAEQNTANFGAGSDTRSSLSTGSTRAAVGAGGLCAELVQNLVRFILIYSRHSLARSAC